MSEDIERIRETLGERAARTYAVRTDIRQLHFSDFRRGDRHA